MFKINCFRMELLQIFVVLMVVAVIYSSATPTGIKHTDQEQDIEVTTPAAKGYQCPEECHCVMDSLDMKFHVTCNVDFIPNFAKFAATISPQTKELSITCLLKTRGDLTAGAFDHLIELEIFALIRCGYSILPHGLFQHQRKLKQLVLFPTIQFRSHIPHNFFRSMVELENLRIWDMPTFNMSADNLCSLGHLNTLDLTSDDIQSIRNMFSGIGINQPCLPSLSTLDLSRNKMAELDIVLAKSCCPGLQTLKLSSSALSHITDGTFDGLLQLESLDLSNNDLIHLNLKNMAVVHLDISHNDLVEVTTNWSNCSLQILDASHNKLTMDVIASFPLCTMEKLNLAYNRISKLSEDSFSEACLLIELNLSGNNLSEMQSDVFMNQRHLEKLNLSTCGLTGVEAGFLNDLSALQTLDLSHNKLENISGLFKNIPYLQQLILTDNRLHNIPSDLALPQLKLLDLSQNLIRNVDDVFKELSNLIHLSLQDNIIDYLPADRFQPLQNIEELNLQNNLIKDIHDKAFAGLSNLKIINLNYNYIKIVACNAIVFGQTNEKTLEEILLKGNDISIIAAYTGDVVFPPSVQKMDLAENNMKRIDPSAFTKMPGLETVNLTHNNLHTLNESAFETEDRTSRTQFFLQNNSLDCTCDMTYLKTINSEGSNKQGFIADLDKLTCRLLNGSVSLVSDVTADEFLCEIGADCDPCKCPPPMGRGQNIPTAPSGGKDKSCTCSQRCPHNCTYIVNQSRSLIIVNCSRKAYHDIPEEMPMSATIMDYSGNELSFLESDSFTSCVNAEVLLLKQNQISSIGPDTFQLLSHMHTLDLSQNRLQQLNSTSFEGLTNLRNFNLSSNQVRLIKKGTFQGLTKLHTLDLRSNMLEQLGLASIFGDVRPHALWLYGNPWRCLCKNKNLKEELLTSTESVQDLSSLTCAVTDPQLVPGNFTKATSLPIIQADFANCQNASEPILQQTSPAVRAGLVSGAVVYVILFVVVLLAMKFRLYVQIYIHDKFGIHFGKNHDNVFRRYDAFVIFNDKDRHFVRSELIPRLETENQLKLCIHLRDWLVGEVTAEAVHDSILNSHRTILILSDHFMENEWSQYEFQAAHLRQIEEKSNKHLIVFLIQDNPPKNLDNSLQMYVTTNNYIRLSDRWCWKKLLFAMPKITEETIARRRNHPTEIEQAHQVQALEMERLNYRYQDGVITDQHGLQVLGRGGLNHSLGPV